MAEIDAAFVRRQADIAAAFQATGFARLATALMADLADAVAIRVVTALGAD